MTRSGVRCEAAKSDLEWPISNICFHGEGCRALHAQRQYGSRKGPHCWALPGFRPIQKMVSVHAKSAHAGNPVRFEDAKGRRMRWIVRSRLGLVLIFGLLLLALDVGRSIWARVGYAYPSTEYRPDPAQYADLTWPPGADVDAEGAVGDAALRAALRRLPRAGRTRERSGRAVHVATSSGLHIRQVQVQVHRARRTAH